MVTEPIRVLVAGATGNQGGAVARHLVEFEGDVGIEVFGLTRDPASPAAQGLAAQGVELVEGDLEDPSTLEPLVADVDAVFGIANFWTLGYERQVTQVTNLAEASAEAEEEHFVASGVGSCREDTGIPHFESVAEIEENIEALDLPHTFLRPVFFMQNFEGMVEDILGGTIAMPLTEGTSLQMVDVEDVGQAAARVFADRESFLAQGIELAGDEMTLSEMAETFSKVSGRDIEPYHVPIEDAREQMGDEWADMCDWFNRVGYMADIPALGKRLGFPLTTLNEYLVREGWDQPASKSPTATPGWIKAMQ